MDPVAFVKAVRRRWPVLAATILLASSVGWIGAEISERRASEVRTYRATATLLGSGSQEGPGIGNLHTLAALTKRGEVPVRVAGKMGFQGDPVLLTRADPPRRPEGIEATADGGTGLMTISATSTDPTEAATLANTFATELVGFLEGRKSTEAQAQAVKAQMDGLQQQIRDLDAAIARRAPNLDFLRAERDSKIRVYGFLYDRYQQLVLGLGGSSLSTSLEIIETASPQLITPSFLGLPSRGLQLIVATLIGLLGGLAIALLLERFDPRIWAKPAAEQHLGFPVIAQVPFVKRRKRKALFVSNPNGGPAADAFRLLAASMARGLSPTAHGKGAESTTGRIGPGVILVTSPGQAEGKTTVAANLAVGFAELGEKVLVISCDFRRPGLHGLFGIEEGDGFAEALSSHSLPLDGKPVLDGFVRPSGFKGLSVILSGTANKTPGELLSSEAMPRAIQEAREHWDIVVLDGPPTLVSETAHLLPNVDTVLVVQRVGRSADAGERASEQLRRLGANVAGITLIGADGEGLPPRYFGPTPGIKEKDVRKRFLRRAVFWRKGESDSGQGLTGVTAPSVVRKAPGDQGEGPEKSDERLEPAGDNGDPGGPLEPAAANAIARQIATYLFEGRPFADRDRHDAEEPSPQDEGPRESVPERSGAGEPMGDIPT